MRNGWLWSSRPGRPALAALALFALLVGCSPATPQASPPAPSSPPSGGAPVAPPTTSASADPIRIGVPLDLTGGSAALGQSEQAGIEVALKQLNGRIAGRPVELIVVDTETVPESGLRATRRLVERDKVDLLIGYLLTPTAYAVRDFIHQSRIPTVMATAASGLSRENKSPYIWRMTPSNFQQGYEPGAKYLQDKLGYKRIIFWGADYAAPHEIHRAAEAVYGANVVKAVWSPLNTTDYSPYLSTIRPGDADAVAAAVFGADGVRLVDQYYNAGLRMPLFGFGSFTSEDVLAGFPLQAVEGVQSSYSYCASLDNAPNKEFVSLFRERTGDIPGDYAYSAYLALQMMARAIEMTNGDVSDPAKIIDALGKVTLENTPTGKQSFDANQGWVTDFFWRTVEVVNGKAVNRCGDRIPQVIDPVREFPTVSGR
jgi:branched-chain amino acid transport system substrate-binding protein